MLGDNTVDGEQRQAEQGSVNTTTSTYFRIHCVSDEGMTFGLTIEPSRVLKGGEDEAASTTTFCVSVLQVDAEPRGDELLVASRSPWDGLEPARR